MSEQLSISITDQVEMLFERSDAVLHALFNRMLEQPPAEAIIEVL